MRKSDHYYSNNRQKDVVKSKYGIKITFPRWEIFFKNWFVILPLYLQQDLRYDSRTAYF